MLEGNEVNRILVEISVTKQMLEGKEVNRILVEISVTTQMLDGKKVNIVFVILREKSFLPNEMRSTCVSRVKNSLCVRPYHLTYALIYRRRTQAQRLM